MRMGVHQEALAAACQAADAALWYNPKSLGWDVEQLVNASDNSRGFDEINTLVAATCAAAKDSPKANIVVMSNGGFDGIHQTIIGKLRQG